MVTVSLIGRLPDLLTFTFESSSCLLVVFLVSASAVLGRRCGLVSSQMAFLGRYRQSVYFQAERPRPTAALAGDSDFWICVVIKVGILAPTGKAVG